MLNHDQMIKKALIDPHKSYKSSNFYYNVDWRSHQGNDPATTRGFESYGRFVSYSTPVADLVRNKITDCKELHITKERHSSTTDRQLSSLRYQAGELTCPVAVYFVPYIHNSDMGRMHPAYLQFAVKEVNESIDELLGKARQYKTYEFKIKMCIDTLKRAIFLMTDTVPEEIFDEYFTKEQKDKLQEAINLRVLLGSLLHHSNGDGRVLKQALLGLRELNK